jgi:RND family efflux transporter MFP subunit
VIVRNILAIAVLGGALWSCSNGAAGDAPSVGSPAATGEGGRGTGGAGGSGRGAPIVVLAASDVHTVVRGTIESTTPLSGDLRPTEEVLLRSRAEGDVIAVLVREGDAVRAGAVLARFETAELDAALAAAEADVAAARGEAATAQWNLEQSRELFRAGAIAEQALKAAEQSALAAQARVAAAQARKATAEINQRDARLVAPAAGTISARLVQTGERVSRGAHLFTLVRDDTLEFTAAVPARAAALVQPGQVVRFSADGRAFTGTIARVSPAVDPASRSVNVFVRVPNRDRSLRANTFATGRVIAEKRDSVLALPLSAVRRSRDEDAPFIYKIDGDAIAIAQVRLGITDDALGSVEVLEGVSENDRVIVGNVGTIGQGMRVQILDADQPPARGGGRGGARGERE